VSQWATVCHAPVEPHHARPHIHTGIAVHYHHDRDSIPEPLDEHDSDAVYVSDDVWASVTPVDVDELTASKWLSFSDGVSCVVPSKHLVVETDVARTCFDNAGYHCALYVRHMAFLI
jgi:hypothetical protein